MGEKEEVEAKEEVEDKVEVRRKKVPGAAAVYEVEKEKEEEVEEEKFAPPVAAVYKQCLYTGPAGTTATAGRCCHNNLTELPQKPRHRTSKL